MSTRKFRFLFRFQRFGNSWCVSEKAGKSTRERVSGTRIVVKHITRWHVVKASCEHASERYLHKVSDTIAKNWVWRRKRRRRRRTGWNCREVPERPTGGRGVAFVLILKFCCRTDGRQYTLTNHHELVTHNHERNFRPTWGSGTWSNWVRLGLLHCELMNWWSGAAFSWEPLVELEGFSSWDDDGDRDHRGSRSSVLEQPKPICAHLL